MALLSSCGQAHGEGVSGEEAPGVYSARFVTRFVACAYLSPVRLSHTQEHRAWAFSRVALTFGSDVVNCRDGLRGGDVGNWRRRLQRSRHRTVKRGLPSCRDNRRRASQRIRTWLSHHALPEITQRADRRYAPSAPVVL